MQLQGNHEEADTRLVPHLCEAVNNSYERVLVVYKGTDVKLLSVLLKYGRRLEQPGR